MTIEQMRAHYTKHITQVIQGDKQGNIALALSVASVKSDTLLDNAYDDFSGHTVAQLLQKSKALTKKIQRGDDILHNSSALHAVNTALGKHHKRACNKARALNVKPKQCKAFTYNKEVKAPQITCPKEQEAYIAKALQEQKALMAKKTVQVQAYAEKGLIFDWQGAVRFYREKGLSRKLAKKYASQGQKEHSQQVRRQEKRAELMRRFLSGAFEGKVLGYVKPSDNRRKSKALGTLQVQAIEHFSPTLPKERPTLSSKGQKERALADRRASYAAKKEAQAQKELDSKPCAVKVRKRSA